ERVLLEAEAMTWYRDATVRRYALWGFAGGLLIVVAGSVVEAFFLRLPIDLTSLTLVQRTQPELWLIDLAPVILAAMAGMIGHQMSLSAVIARAKKEWEQIFDAVSDPVLVVDENGRIIRCNHAVIDRLNTTFQNVVGRPFSEVLLLGGQG